MKKYYALLPSHHYYNLDEYSKRIFNISLLTYDGIYTMTSKLNLLNQKKVLKENFRLEDFFLQRIHRLTQTHICLCDSFWTMI